MWFGTESTDRSDAILWPGAVMSGFVLPSRVGPRELKQAMSPNVSVKLDPHHEDVIVQVVALMSVHCFFVV